MRSFAGRTVVIALSWALLGSACGSDDPSASAPQAREWSESDLAGAPRYDGPGPHAVGVHTLDMTDDEGGTEQVVVWYPAAGSASAEPVVDADGDDGDDPYPLVVFAHGLGLSASDHSRQLATIASWGFVVAGPEAIKGTDLVAVAEVVRSAAEQPDTPVTDIVAPSGPIVVGGFSAGTTAAVTTSSDRGPVEVVGVLLMAGGGPAGAGDTAASPTLFLAGGRDPATDDWARPGFEITTEPSELVLFEDAGHLTFSDLCHSDPSTNDADCAPDEVGEEALWPLIDHASVAFLRWRFGLDATPISLDPDLLTDVIASPVVVEGSFAA